MRAGEPHSVVRTSPKGGPFVGRCVKCGIGGLSLAQAARGGCVNPAGLDGAEAMELVLRELGHGPQG